MALVRFQRVFNRRYDVRQHWIMAGRESCDDLTVAVDEEVRKNPFDIAPELRIGLLIGQEFIERSLIVAFNGNLAKQIEGRLIFSGTELFDFSVRARLLMSEVVGWECQ